MIRQPVVSPLKIYFSRWNTFCPVSSPPSPWTVIQYNSCLDLSLESSARLLHFFPWNVCLRKTEIRHPTLIGMIMVAMVQGKSIVFRILSFHRMVNHVYLRVQRSRVAVVPTIRNAKHGFSAFTLAHPRNHPIQ